MAVAVAALSVHSHSGILCAALMILGANEMPMEDEIVATGLRRGTRFKVLMAEAIIVTKEDPWCPNAGAA